MRFASQVMVRTSTLSLHSHANHNTLYNLKKRCWQMRGIGTCPGTAQNIYDDPVWAFEQEKGELCGNYLRGKIKVIFVYGYKLLMTKFVFSKF